MAYAYDAASRLTRIVQEPLSPITLQYDPVGRRTLLTLPNGVSTEYQYDVASRLAALIYRKPLGPLGDLTYTYDPAGNRASVGGTFGRTLLPDSIPSATYDAANQQLTFGDKTITFDANGNLATLTDLTGTTTFTWDSRNRLTALSGPGATASFTYDALNRRAMRTVNAQTTQHLYDRLDVVQELAEGTPASYVRSLNIDEPFSRNGQEFYLPDVLGSTIALADPFGQIATTYTYEPFGRTTPAATAANPFQFTGREHDGTGLYYYRARYYHSTLHRFISEDPLALHGGDVNLYVYVRNSPVRLIDPTGFLASPWHFATSFAAMTATGHGPVDGLVVAGASVFYDYGTQGVADANTHAQVRPGQSISDAVAQHQKFVENQLMKGTRTGLGYANHAVEDAPRHQFEPFTEMNFSDPKYLWHLSRDFTPWPWELWDAFKSDLRNIEKWDAIRRTNRTRPKRK